MKFKWGWVGGQTSLLANDGDQWSAIGDAHRREHTELIAMLEANSPVGADNDGMRPALQPRSYRDFMLFERHFVQAGRGYLRRFRPGVARLARGYEALSKRTFPPLRPPSLWYRQPIYYMGNHLAIVGDGTRILWPSYTQALDYELELGFCLKRPLLNATPEEALAAIGGFAVFNDFSARDVQMPEMDSGFGPQKSKHFGSALGAVLVSADEVLPVIDRMEGRVAINERVVARCSSRGMQFTLGEALAHVSRSETLFPGELFATGTWPDGSGLENGHWLQPGDTIRLEIDGIGSVENIIAS